MHDAMRDRIEVVTGDITELDVDAVVNAANRALAGGGGVDGAIHRAAGPELLDACRPFAPCATGDACITPGFRMRARWIIHTVGPVYEGGHRGEAELLASCYRRSLELAASVNAASIAFPAISTGAYRYPLKDACGIAVRTVCDVLSHQRVPARVMFCMFDDRSARVIEQVLSAS